MERIEWLPYLRTRITEYMDGRVQKFIEKLEEMGVAYESSGSAALLNLCKGHLWASREGLKVEPLGITLQHLVS